MWVSAIIIAMAGGLAMWSLRRVRCVPHRGRVGAEPVTGRLIVFEGADASGKSTQARRLASRLGAELTFQFGATEIGSAIRSILLDPAHAALDDRAEALLVIADKAQHVAEIVGPALERGETIVSDRYTASSPPTRATDAGSISINSTP